MSSADRTSLTGVLGFALNGIAQYEPELKAVIDTEINDHGKATLDALSRGCIGDALLRSQTAFTPSSSWTVSGESLRELALRLPEVKASVDRQRIGALTPTVPVQVLTGTKDDIVAHGQAKQLAADWCAQGVTVSYVPVIQPVSSHGTALNHLGPAITRSALSQQWLVDRLQGRPALSNCAALPYLP